MTSDEIIDEMIVSLGTSIFALVRAENNGELKYVSGHMGFGHDLRGMRMISKESGRWRLTVLGRAIRERVLAEPRYLAEARAKAETAQREWEADMAKRFNRKFPKLEAAGEAVS